MLLFMHFISNRLMFFKKKCLPEVAAFSLLQNIFLLPHHEQKEEKMHLLMDFFLKKKAKQY